jgi:alpha-tubulin suppressor-like RCC1 family protein
MENIAFVSAGTGYWLAVDKSGKLWGYGTNNSSGQIKRGITVPTTEPVEIMNDVAFASAGTTVSAAVKTDGSLWAWGELGGSEPEKIAENVSAADSGYSANGNVGLLYISGGKLYALGYDAQSGTDYDSPKEIMSDVAYISAYGGTVEAIKTDGTVTAWGDNSLAGLCSDDVSETGPVTIPIK